MKLANVPTKVPLPFANSGSKNAIPTASQIGITPGAASLTDGFPPLTFTPLAAGGIPPAGADFNGILNLLSANTQWNNAGAFYPYDSTFSTSIGGYPEGAILSRADGTGFWLSTEDDNTTDPETDTSGAWVPINNQGVASVALSNANVSLTPLQYAKRIVILTGALLSNVQVVFPAFAGMKWLVVNQTTGAFSVTCKTAATGFILGQGRAQEAWADGTNLNTLPDTATLSYALDTGAANAYVVALSPAPTAYVDGMPVTFQAANPNSGASTLNVNNLGDVDITRGGGALGGGEILAGQDYTCVYNKAANQFFLQAQSAGAVIVGTATAPYHATALGQVLNGVAPVAANANGNAATGATTTAVLTAPCDGYALVIGSFSSSTDSLSGTGITASLAGLVEVMNPSGGNYFNQSVWYLPMTKGQSSTFTATLSQAASGVYTVSVVATFQPNPGT